MTNIDFTPIFHALETENEKELNTLVSELNPSTIAGTGAYFWQSAPNDLPIIGLAVGLSLMIVLPLASFLGFFIA